MFTFTDAYHRSQPQSQPSPATFPMSSDVVEGLCLGCETPTTKVCPNCKSLDLQPAYFCSKDCFKTSWKAHKIVHAEAECHRLLGRVNPTPPRVEQLKKPFAQFSPYALSLFEFNDAPAVLHGVLTHLLVDNLPRFLTTLGAKLHALDGRHGMPLLLDRETIEALAQRIPFYGHGTVENMPPESYKLFATVVRVLCSAPTVASVATAAAASSESSPNNVFPSSTADRNEGLLGAAIETAIRASHAESSSTAISCGISDQYVMRNPYTMASFAHIFVVVVFPKAGQHAARVYPAFGPPNIGYSCIDCIRNGSASRDMSPAELNQFKEKFNKFERSRKWTPAVQALHQELFVCRLKMPPGYSVICRSFVHSDKFTSASVKQVAQVLLI